MATSYQVCTFEKKPSRKPLPKRGQIKNKILADVFSAIVGGSRKEQVKESEEHVTIGNWSSTSLSGGGSFSASKASGHFQCLKNDGYSLFLSLVTVWWLFTFNGCSLQLCIYFHNLKNLSALFLLWVSSYFRRSPNNENFLCCWCLLVPTQLLCSVERRKNIF